MKQGLVDIIINGDPNKSRSMTTHGFLISISVSVALCSLYVLLFSFLRKSFRSLYEPRTFVVANHLRTPQSSSGLLNWIVATLRVPSAEIASRSGPDAYFFMRYVKFVMLTCAVLGLPLLVVLLPLHVTGSRPGIHGLDRLSTSNIGDAEIVRHVAHLLICIFSTIGWLIVFRLELRNHFRMRAVQLVDQADISGSTSTILVKGLHEPYRNIESIKDYFSGLASLETRTACRSSDLDSVVQRVWFNRDYSELHSLVKKRKSVLKKLESAELWLIERSLGLDDDNRTPSPCELKDSYVVGNLWRRYVSSSAADEMNHQRGCKLTWLKSEMSKLNAQIFSIQQRTEAMPAINSCFIQFDSKLSAFIASRSLGSDQSIGIGSEIFDTVHPADIIWSNLDTITWGRCMVRWGAVGVNALLIVGFSIFTSIISQVDSALPESDWILRLLLSDVLRPLVVAGATSLVPNFFRILARLKGYPTTIGVEMDVQKYLFLFMFVQLFLIVMGLPVLIPQLLFETREGAITFANSLSKASTFFISYVMANSLTTAGNALLQSQQLCLWFWNRRQGKTPRQKLKNNCQYTPMYWGSIYPLITNIGTIAIAYALISPIIMVSALIGLCALYIAFRYRILYCYVPRSMSSGDFYPTAMFQLFFGFYCQQVSLFGTLLVSSQLALAILVVPLFILTMVCHSRLYLIFVDLSTRIPLKSNGLLPNSAEIEDEEVAVGITPCSTAVSKEGRYNKYALSSGISRSDGTSQCDDTLQGKNAPQNGDTFQSAKSAKGSTTSRYAAVTPDGSTPTPISPISGTPFVTTPMSAPYNPSSRENAYYQENQPRTTTTGTNRSAGTRSSGPTGPQDPNSSAGPNGPNGPNGSSQPIVNETNEDSLQEAWTGIFDSLTSDFSSLTPGQQEYVSSQLFEHPDRRMPRPCVWLPSDWRGVAHDQVMEMQNFFTDLRCSAHGANIDGYGNITIYQLPPDFDPLEVMRI